MAFNKQYNTRFSGRYNSPGQFVSAGEVFGQTVVRKPTPQQPQNANLQTIQTNDVEMKVEPPTPGKSEEGARPHWMKSKLPGIKKVSNKERRRRQNENLRRLLTPKNPLMVLNEMMPNEQVTNQFKVEVLPNQYYKNSNQHSFCADLTLDGQNYKGYGENKMVARNAAAEQAIRDLIIKKMSKVIGSEAGSTNGDGTDEESLPMIQLASFALYKLFTEWEDEGHKVPQLKQLFRQQPEAEPVKKSKELPPGAATMHPCMLLTYMRPQQEYRELAADGDRPQNMMFTIGVDVDGATYIGKASNKREARKQAATIACQALFGVKFENTPKQ